VPPRNVLLPAILPVAAIACSLFLLIWRLDWIGFTWDEFIDYNIVGSFAANAAEILRNDMDPSQGRLNHMVAAPFVVLFGHTLLVFKAIYVGVGLAAAIALFFLLSRIASRTTALLLVATFVSSPYFLTASRSGGTSGDVLTILCTVAFCAALGHWSARHEAGRPGWGPPAICAVACGLGLGAKLTNGLWIPAAVIFMVLRHGWKNVWREFGHFVPIAAAVAVLAHPLLFRGPVHLWNALRHSHGFDGAKQFLYLGEFVTNPQWYFPLFVLLAKTSPLFFAFFLWVAVRQTWSWARGGQAALWFAVGMLVFYVDYLFLAKRFQNAQYYVPAFVAMFVICAAPVDRLLHDARAGVRRLTYGAFALSLGLQAWINWDLWPDFAQAGRHYGSFMQGQMAGPAVNHCQGGPVTIDELNSLQRKHNLPAAYVLLHCGPIINTDNHAGPVKSLLSLPDYPIDNPPPRPHWVLVNRVYDYSEPTRADQEFRIVQRERLLAGCRMLSRRPDGPYKIYACE